MRQLPAPCVTHDVVDVFGPYLPVDHAPRCLTPAMGHPQSEARSAAMPHILLAVVHPRSDSLTHAVARAFAQGTEVVGHRVVWADLYAEGFNPVLLAADEPDWDDLTKTYSPEVRAEMARIEAADATVIVFPVWWWSMPAMPNGWIDRVWNHGWAYGDGARYPLQRVWMLAIAGGTGAQFSKRGYDTAMATQIETGVLGYCRVDEARLIMLYGTLEGTAECEAVVAEARALGAVF